MKRRRMFRGSRSLSAFLSALLLLLGTTQTSDGAKAGAHPLMRRLEIINYSGEDLAVDWVNPKVGKPQPFRISEDGLSLALDTYVNHTFVFRTKHESSAAAASEVGQVTISENKTTHFVLIQEGPEVRVFFDDDEEKGVKVHPWATDIVFKCRIRSDTALERGSLPEKVISDLYDCLEQETALAIEKLSEELGFQSEMRLKLSYLMENHTCADPEMVTTTPKQVKNWTHNGVTRQVGILHDRPSSQIHVLHNFISREECEAVEAAAKPTLHRGTVADGKGGSQMSQSRKAWQAGIEPDWSKEADGDEITAVVRRLFDYANHVTGYNMSVDGQENLMSIQYFGEGVDDPTPDRYMPHCDGECDGLPHKKGGRVATMVMYCDVPELGGATNFQNANVFVKPEVGAAAFFSYMDPKTGDHETGFTSHSGCPVLLGTKRIAVQWLRVGVDTENPWDSFDTNTVSNKLKQEFDALEAEEEAAAAAAKKPDGQDVGDDVDLDDWKDDDELFMDEDGEDEDGDDDDDDDDEEEEDEEEDDDEEEEEEEDYEGNDEL